MNETVISGEPIIQLTENGLEGFEVLCRLCANRSDHLISIYSEEGVSNGLAEKMNLYLPVKVAKSDTLPLQCCYQCASTVLTWHELVIASVETDRRLRSIQDEVEKQLAVHAEPGPSQDVEKPENERCAVHLLTDTGHPVSRGTIADSLSFTTYMINNKNLHQNLHRNDSETSIDTQRAMVEGSIDAQHATLESNIDTKRATVEGSIDIKRAMVEGSIDAKRAMLEGSIDTKRVMLESSIDTKLAPAEGSIDTHHATLESSIDTKRATVEDSFDTNRAPLESSIDPKHATLERSIDTNRAPLETSIDNSTKTSSFGEIQVKSDKIPTQSTINQQFSIRQSDKTAINTKLTVKHARNVDKITKSNANDEEKAQDLLVDDPDHARAVRKTFQCELCGRHFFQKLSLERHARIHRDERPYTCDVCGKGFRDKSGLTRHIDHVHGRLKRFACDLCARAFASGRTRDDHRRRHTKERPYMCQTCGKSFACSATLYIHAKTHTDVFPFECSVCGKQFRRRQELVAHASTHTGARPYACADCDKCFRRKDYLALHRLVHTDVKPYECSVCGMRYRQARYLKNHMKAKHGSAK